MKTPSLGIRLLTRMCVSALAIVAIVAIAGPAKAGTKRNKDEVRGFQYSIEDSFEQVPPKPGTADAHVAAVWKDPSAKYGRFSGDQPTFKIIWTVQPKGDAPPADERELPAWARDLPPEMQDQVRANMAGTKETLESDVNTLMERLAFLFGPYKPFAERLEEQKKPKTIKTGSGQKLRILEVNYHKKRPKGTDATWWLWIAFTEFETETEKIELGFYGYVDVKFAKKVFRKQFERVVKSFKMREFEVTEAKAGGKYVVENPDSPEEKKVADFIKNKVIPGWSTYRTPHYLVVHDDDVDRDLVRRVANEIEALRAQVYEVLFPPDRPITSISFVRVCETRKQYSAYGAPGGSAGYWSSGHEELVLYQDKGAKKDAVRVLYHEAFHQYIFYSVGEISPHSWFNEGHGDYFSGHVYKGGKFKRETFSWRTGPAREAKRRWEEGIEREKNNPKGATSPEILHLPEWLTWRQPQYYGRNDWGISQGDNYALGWSFIYFLRTTKNKQYQQILPRYFNALKSFVTQDLDARATALEKGLEGEDPGAGANPEGGPEAGEKTEPTADETDRYGGVERSEWHGESLKEAIQGVDIVQLEKDWLKHRW